MAYGSQIVEAENEVLRAQMKQIREILRNKSLLSFEMVMRIRKVLRMDEKR